MRVTPIHREESYSWLRLDSTAANLRRFRPDLPIFVASASSQQTRAQFPQSSSSELLAFHDFPLVGTLHKGLY